MEDCTGSKPNSSIRFCIGYQDLNKDSHKYAYMIPRVDTVQFEQPDAQYIMKINLKGAY